MKMNETVVVNMYTSEYDVYIGRAGKGMEGFWGNPYIVGRDGTLDEVLDKYRAYIMLRIKNGDISRADLQKLAGKRLGCFCKPKKCHGDVLVDIMRNTLGK